MTGCLTVGMVAVLENIEYLTPRRCPDSLCAIVPTEKFVAVIQLPEGDPVCCCFFTTRASKEAQSQGMKHSQDSCLNVHIFFQLIHAWALELSCAMQYDPTFRVLHVASNNPLGSRIVFHTNSHSMSLHHQDICNGRKLRFRHIVQEGSSYQRRR